MNPFEAVAASPEQNAAFVPLTSFRAVDNLTPAPEADGAAQDNYTRETLSPEPLPSLPDVLPFDYSYLPDALRGYVKDISERMQCPPDFAAVGVLVMMGSIIGRKVSIRPKRKDDWTVILNLWGAVVGNSGVMCWRAFKNTQKWAL